VCRAIVFHLKNYFLFRQIRKAKSSYITQRFEDFDFFQFRNAGKNFLETKRCGSSPYMYKVSESATMPTLYGSAYACMTLDLFGEIDRYSEEERLSWCSYFNSFQSSESGLFHDLVIKDDPHYDSDWWGARHLALHMISAYASLGSKPKYPFYFLKKYYGSKGIENWLDGFDWIAGPKSLENDIDNQIMNIGCLLQYQRDVWNDIEAGLAVDRLKNYLRQKILSSTGLWGEFDDTNALQRSRVVQFAYHLMPIFFYDNDYEFDYRKIVICVLKTQNKFDGFGAKFNSSACEDIDSIYLLLNFRKMCSPKLQCQIDDSLSRAYSWILFNKNNDNGFVFRMFEELMYGHAETSMLKNESGLFPTWFRILSIAQIDKVIGHRRFVLKRTPGYNVI